MGMSSTNVMGTFYNRGSRMGTMGTWEEERGRRIQAARAAKKWSQADLGRAAGLSQPAIKKMEDGGGSKHMARVFLVLGLDPKQIDPPSGANGPLEGQDIAPFPGARLDFPIYAAAEGGPGEILRSSDPVDYQPRPQPLAQVRNSYGLYVVGESMSPEYRPGDVALINPNLPIIGDEVYVFYAEREGEARATIKHLRRATGDKWLVSQHNKPREFDLNRKEWQWAHRVIGKYSRQ